MLFNIVVLDVKYPFPVVRHSTFVKFLIKSWIHMKKIMFINIAFVWYSCAHCSRSVVCVHVCVCVCTSRDFLISYFGQLLFFCNFWFTKITIVTGSVIYFHVLHACWCKKKNIILLLINFKKHKHVQS